MEIGGNDECEANQTSNKGEESLYLKSAATNTNTYTSVAKEDSTVAPDMGSSLKYNSTESKILWKKGTLIGEGTYGRVYRGLNIQTGFVCRCKTFSNYVTACTTLLYVERFPLKITFFFVSYSTYSF